MGGPKATGTCAFPSCSSRLNARGLCSSHYQQARRGEPLRPVTPNPHVNRGQVCAYDTCDRPARSKGLCHSPRRHQVRFGELRPIQEMGPRGEGTVRRTDGYRFVSVQDDPFYGSTVIAQHRLVMAHHIGRALRSNENVHHVNGDRLDNRLENLELWSSWQPPGQRIEDKVAWAKELLAFYEPEALK